MLMVRQRRDRISGGGAGDVLEKIVVRRMSWKIQKRGYLGG